MASVEMNDRTESTSNVRSGFVYGLSDGNWFGFVCSSDLLVPLLLCPNAISSGPPTFYRVVRRIATRTITAGRSEGLEHDPLTSRSDLIQQNVHGVSQVYETDSPVQDQFTLNRQYRLSGPNMHMYEDRRASSYMHASSPTSSNGPMNPRHSIAESVVGSIFKDRYLASLRGQKLVRLVQDVTLGIPC